MNHVLIMILNQLKIVFSMELEIAIQNGVYKRATKTKNDHLIKNLHFVFNFYFINFIWIFRETILIFDQRYIFDDSKKVQTYFSVMKTD